MGKLFLVDVRNVTSFCFLANDWDAVWIFLPDSLRLRFSLFEDVLLLEL